MQQIQMLHLYCVWWSLARMSYLLFWLANSGCSMHRVTLSDIPAFVDIDVNIWNTESKSMAGVLWMRLPFGCQEKGLWWGAQPAIGSFPCVCNKRVRPSLSWELQSPNAHPRLYSIGDCLMSMPHTAALDRAAFWCKQQSLQHQGCHHYASMQVIHVNYNYDVSGSSRRFRWVGYGHHCTALGLSAHKVFVSAFVLLCSIYIWGLIVLSLSLLSVFFCFCCRAGSITTNFPMISNDFSILIMCACVACWTKWRIVKGHWHLCTAQFHSMLRGKLALMSSMLLAMP